MHMRVDLTPSHSPAKLRCCPPGDTGERPTQPSPFCHLHGGVPRTQRRSSAQERWRLQQGLDHAAVGYGVRPAEGIVDGGMRIDAHEVVDGGLQIHRVDPMLAGVGRQHV